MYLFAPHFYRRRFRNAVGFTLTEIAIVLGVIGLVIGGIWVVASMVQENARVSAAASQLNLTAQNMTSLFQGGYNPPVVAGTDITPSMISAQVIPTWAKISATQASHPWNNSGFTMKWQGANPRTYRMVFSQVTHSGCVGLINQATACTPGQPGCPTNIVTGNGGTSFNLQTGGPLTTTQVQTLCTANNYAGGANMVAFDFTN